MKRRTMFKLPLFLVAGAIINVAVAWGFVARAVYLGNARNAVGCQYWHYDGDNGGGVIVLAGVPLKALCGSKGHVLVVDLSTRSASLKQFTNTLLSMGTAPEELLFPYRPIWPGFLINTIFYTAILWVLFAAPFVIRRRIRIKRSQCASCAYSLRGRGTPGSGTCPECGATA